MFMRMNGWYDSVPVSLSTYQSFPVVYMLDFSVKESVFIQHYLHERCFRYGSLVHKNYIKSHYNVKYSSIIPSSTGLKIP